MAAHPTARITRRDWTGDAVLALAAGLVCLASVLLPWANADTPDSFNRALSHPAWVRGLMSTGWGWPALSLALLATVTAIVMLVIGPRRAGIALGLLTGITGVAILLVAADALSEVYTYQTEAGLGLVLTILAGIMLVPIGLAAAAVAWVLQYLQPRQAAAAARAAPPPR